MTLTYFSTIDSCFFVGVVFARFLMFPLVINSQKNAVAFHNIMPQMQEIQLRMDAARTYGNNVESNANFIQLKSSFPILHFGFAAIAGVDFQIFLRLSENLVALVVL